MYSHAHSEYHEQRLLWPLMFGLSHLLDFSAIDKKTKQSRTIYILKCNWLKWNLSHNLCRKYGLAGNSKYALIAMIFIIGTSIKVQSRIYNSFLWCSKCIFTINGFIFVNTCLMSSLLYRLLRINLLTFTFVVISFEMTWGGSDPCIAGKNVQSKVTSDKTSMTCRGFSTWTSTVIASDYKDKKKQKWMIHDTLGHSSKRVHHHYKSLRINFRTKLLIIVFFLPYIFLLNFNAHFHSVYLIILILNRLTNCLQQICYWMHGTLGE